MQQIGADDPSSSTSKAPGSGLEFVLVDQPTKRASGDVRRRVRSHVTKLQHQKNREREIESHATSSRPFISYSSESAKHRTAPKKKSGKVTKAKKSKVSVVEQDAAEKAAVKFRHANVLQIRSPRKEEPTENDEDEWLAQAAAPYWTHPDRLALSDLGIAFSRGTMCFRTFALDDSTNTVGSSLEALGLDVASVLECYKLIVQIQARDFERSYVLPQPDVIVWERFYKFIFTDPVLLTVALLITIRYRLECLGDRNRSKDFIQVLQLEDFLIKRVNAALKEPGRAISDPMLVAVALCSAYEVKHGSPEAYHIHMQGLLRMIDLRGGLPAIGRHDPYLERMLVWHDVNTSAIIGHNGYLPHLPNSLEKARPGSSLPTFKAPIETNEDAWISRFERGSRAGS